MSDIAIKVENLGKLYRLGEVGTGTLSHDLNRWFAKMRGKEDPFSRVGEKNDRTQKGDSDYVWALQNVNFEVKQGEVLGIIGRNGAGKSTLLKLLSKVTKPTTGQMKIRGRIASLLEVGTGFHPEMTGRENIFLNGAILGMTRREIRAKFDEIVDFAGVERYVDTPVKRYSSGMYVRLAFAVAAFLEPEILIIDEVLAVGDAEFQRKCLGRMKDVSVNDGRTVLFVSHNMTSVISLCTQAILMEQGTIAAGGAVEHIVQEYFRNNSNETGLIDSVHRNGNGKAMVTSVEFGSIHNDGSKSPTLIAGLKSYFKFNIKTDDPSLLKRGRLDFRIDSLQGTRLLWFTTEVQEDFQIEGDSIVFELPRLPLIHGKYILTTYLEIDNEVADWIQHGIFLDVQEGPLYKRVNQLTPNQAQIYIEYTVK